MRFKKRKDKGSVIVEGTIVITLLLFIVILQLELVRRVWTGLTLQLISFEQVRARVFGISTDTPEKETRELMRLLKTWTACGPNYPKSNSEDLGLPAKKVAVARIHIKYPSLLSFDGSSGVKKYNYEVTERCRFPYVLH